MGVHHPHHAAAADMFQDHPAVLTYVLGSTKERPQDLHRSTAVDDINPPRLYIYIHMCVYIHIMPAKLGGLWLFV